MRQIMDANKTGLSLGILFAIMHLLGITLISVFGERFLTFAAGLHFLGQQIPIFRFNLGTAVIGICLAFFVGYSAGAVYASIRNKLEKF
jgi:hypothetical protein